MGNSVMKAAESLGKAVIGVDVDQSSESPSVITSAMKNIKGAVFDQIQNVYNNSFEGGQVNTFDVSVQGVILPMKSSKFNKFNEEQYNKVYEKILNKEINVLNDKEFSDISEFDFKKVDVTSI